MKRKNNIQKKVLSLLAIEKDNGNPVLSISYIREKLKLDKGQLAQAKRMLVRKGLVTGISGEMSLIGKYAYQEDRCIYSQVCSHLTSKKRRPCFCPVKKAFIDEKHFKEMCGCRQAINYSNPLDGPTYEPQCNGWMRV